MYMYKSKDAKTDLWDTPFISLRVLLVSPFDLLQGE